MPARPIQSTSPPCSIRWNNYTATRCNFCSAAATAKPTGCPMKRGVFSGQHLSDGAASRRSAILLTRTSHLATNIPAPLEQPARHTRHQRASAETSPTWPITFCRCLNIPARYCTGYVTDIGLPPPCAPMDFAAWMEVYLGGRWRTFDPRNNAPRIGRILIAYGRDAADVPLTHIFGPGKLSVKGLDG